MTKKMQSERGLNSRSPPLDSATLVMPTDIGYPPSSSPSPSSSIRFKPVVRSYRGQSDHHDAKNTGNEEILTQHDDAGYEDVHVPITITHQPELEGVAQVLVVDCSIPSYETPVLKAGMDEILCHFPHPEAHWPPDTGNS